MSRSPGSYYVLEVFEKFGAEITQDYSQYDG